MLRMTAYGIMYDYNPFPIRPIVNGFRGLGESEPPALSLLNFLLVSKESFISSLRTFF